MERSYYTATWTGLNGQGNLLDGNWELGKCRVQFTVRDAWTRREDDVVLLKHLKFQ